MNNIHILDNLHGADKEEQQGNKKCPSYFYKPNFHNSNIFFFQFTSTHLRIYKKVLTLHKALIMFISQYLFDAK